MANFIREFSGMGSRPYPMDRERRRRVLVALAERDMTISGLAKNIGVAQSTVSQIICGRRISPKTEQRIAEFLDKSIGDLFPSRTPGEIGEMRRAEAAGRGAA